MLEEVLEGAFEADPLHDLAHLAMDALDLAQADVVDLLGGVIGGRVIAEALVVIIGAVGKAPDAVVGGSDLLLRFHQGDDALVGGLHLLDQDLAALRDQARLVGLRDRCRVHLLLQILEQGGILARAEGGAGDDVARVADDVRIDPFGRQHAHRLPLFGLDEQLVHHVVDALEAADISLGGGEVGHAMDIDEEGRQLRLRPIHLVEDVAVLAEGEGAFAAHHHILKQVVGKLVGGREAGAVELALHRGEGAQVQLMLRDGGGVGEIAPNAVILVDDAAIGLGQRRQLQLGLVIGFEERGELGAVLGGCGRCGGRRGFGRRSLRHRRAGGDEGGGGEQNQSGHEARHPVPGIVMGPPLRKRTPL